MTGPPISPRLPAWERAAWPLDAAAEALAALAGKSGLASAPQGPGTQPVRNPADGPGPWIEDLARSLGLEAEPVEVPYGEVPRLVRECGPALLLIPAIAPEEGGPGSGSSPDTGVQPAPSQRLRSTAVSERSLLLAVLGCRWGRVRLLGPDLSVLRLPAKEVAQVLRRGLEAPVAAGVERLLGRIKVPPRRYGRAREALLAERLGPFRLSGYWLLRLPPSASFRVQLVRAGLPWELLKFLGFYAVSYSLLLLSWWTLGRGALRGVMVGDWLLAWALLLFSLIPTRLLSIWAQAKLTVGTGSLLKRRLLYGTLRMEPEEIRHQGAGQLLGRVIEAESLELNVLQGGFLASVALIELFLSGFVLSRGAGGWPHALILLLWWLGLLLLGWRYFRRRESWTDCRLELTHDLVESLVGHRTRMAQEERADWHDRDDQHFESYLAHSRSMDRSEALLLSLVPRGWLLVGLCGLAPAFVAAGSTVAGLALGVGGILTAFRAFSKLSRGLGQLLGAWISWRQALPIFRAAARPEELGAQMVAYRSGAVAGRSHASQPLIEARDVVFRYHDRARATLRECRLKIFPGERLLLEGTSGGGKSTLAAVLTALRRPDSGLLLLGGLDLPTIGAGSWRRRVVSAPQFHENHVFTETFAFNLLMGRNWPPDPRDLAEAEEVCREVGLGELLERMPAGLMQLVGETGWQLSHGERSRLFIARALLQGAELIVLDESFAALDPENLRLALACTLKRAPSLLVIAHP
ncbi:MAG: ABC transporter ATP-binding protein [bacterium]|nr:ABC transporter ATP-binding protein [bacterium]